MVCERPNIHCVNSLVCSLLLVLCVRSRVEVARGELPLCGAYSVEEEDDGEGPTGSVLRRLVFLRNQHVIQTEVRIGAEAVRGRGRDEGGTRAGFMTQGCCVMVGWPCVWQVRLIPPKKSSGGGGGGKKKKGSGKKTPKAAKSSAGAQPSYGT